MHLDFSRLRWVTVTPKMTQWPTDSGDYTIIIDHWWFTTFDDNTQIAFLGNDDWSPQANTNPHNAYKAFERWGVGFTTVQRPLIIIEHECEWPTIDR